MVRSHSASTTQTHVSPWIAVNLSVLCPGVGQLYSRAFGKGMLIAIAFGSLLGYTLWSIYAAPGNTLAGLWSLVGLLGIYLASLVDAYRTTQQPVMPIPVKGLPQQKDPWYAVFLSQILPGLGHLYLQKPGIGGLLLLVGSLLTYWANFYPTLLVIPPFIWAVGCYHVHQLGRSTRDPKHNMILLLVMGLVVVRLVVGYIPVWMNAALEQCIVPSESMQPTLMVNDRIFVSKQADYTPQLGDIVTFEAPVRAIATLDAKPNTLFVKRIIGLPGNTVQVKDGRVWINQHPLTESYIKAPANYEWGPETVPAHTYFVLGDNRNFSGDSHVWGFLPQSDILGKAYKIYWPPGRIQAL